MEKGVKEVGLEQEIEVWLLTEEIKEAVYRTAEINPAGIPFVKDYHIDRIRKSSPSYIANGVEEELSGFF
jgi:hypothetical protein